MLTVSFFGLVSGRTEFVAYAKEKYRSFGYKKLSQDEKDALTDQWQIETLQHLEKTGHGGSGLTEMPAVQVVTKLGRQLQELVSFAFFYPLSDYSS